MKDNKIVNFEDRRTTDEDRINGFVNSMCGKENTEKEEKGKKEFQKMINDGTLYSDRNFLFRK